MRPSLFALLGLASVLLLATAPSANACHITYVPPPDCSWDDQPYGVVPFAQRCSGSLRDRADLICESTTRGINEILYGCPNSGLSCL